MAIRVYIDSSVVGGVFDEEFSVHTKRFFAEVRKGLYIPVVSSLTIDEMSKAPPHVRRFFEAVCSQAEMVAVPETAPDLAMSYMTQGRFTKWMYADCLHIAIAALSGVTLIASWNFRHIVNLDRIRVFNSVNLRKGVSLLEIRSPREILHEEDL